MPEKESSVFIAAPSLSIIIVSWNTCDDLTNCIRSLYDHLPPELNYEIVVLDNASTDQTRAIIQSKFPKVLYVQNLNNLGFSKANNIGIKHARGKYILLLNPDTLLTADCVTPLLQQIESDQTIGLIACRLDNKDRTLQWSADLFPIPLHELNLRFRSQRAKLTAQINQAVKTSSQCDVGCVVGAFQLMSRDLLTRLGMLDERLFMYGEDLDLCYRIQKSGKRIVFDCSVSLVHLGGQSSEQVWSDTVRLSRVRESLFRVHYKHFGLTSAVLSLFVRVQLAWVRWAIASATFADGKTRQTYLAEAQANSRTFGNIPNLVQSMSRN